jgi:hypothetical protein
MSLLCTASHTDRWDERSDTDDGPVAECLTCHQVVALVPKLRRPDLLVLDNHKGLTPTA